MGAEALTIATRPSELARWQAGAVERALGARWPELRVDLQVITTRGDRTLDQPLPQIGGKGIFTAELEAALRAGEADLAVHSLKDLPVEDPPGLCLGAILLREDPRDVLVTGNGKPLDQLQPGSVVGTSSNRRAAQLLALRPDLQIRPIRGNVDTRVRKVREGEYDAAVLAAAGLLRLGLKPAISQWFTPEQMLPAPGQGALAVQCRADDRETLELLAELEDPELRQLVVAERAMLEGLGGGCAAPVGALATPDNGAIRLAGMVGALDGSRVVRRSLSGSDPKAVGHALAERLLANGAEELIVHAA